jgi:hypothetical protein
MHSDQKSNCKGQPRSQQPVLRLIRPIGLIRPISPHTSLFFGSLQIRFTAPFHTHSRSFTAIHAYSRDGGRELHGGRCRKSCEVPSTAVKLRQAPSRGFENKKNSLKISMCIRVNPWLRILQKSGASGRIPAAADQKIYPQKAASKRSGGVSSLNFAILHSLSSILVCHLPHFILIFRPCKIRAMPCCHR